VRVTGSPTVTPAIKMNVISVYIIFAVYLGLTRLFVNLDGRLICINSDDFAHKVVVTNGDLRKV
jgi:hypothetical protein